MLPNRRANVAVFIVALSVLSGLTASELSALAAPPPAVEGPPPVAAPASPDVEAELKLPIQYEDGLKLYNLGDYANARIKFKEAYEGSKHPMALWYEAVCAKKGADYAAYIRLVGEVQSVDAAALIAGGVDPTDLANLPASLPRAMRYVGPLRLRADQAGAEVFVDDVSIGKTPLPPPSVLLNIGERKIRVVKAGFKDVEQTVKVAGGAVVDVAVTLERIVREGRLSVKAGPDGLIWIDDKMVGRAAWEGAVRSGGHTLKVSAPGKLPKEQEVVVVDDQRREIQVTLAPEPSEPWKNWVWLGVGGALFSGTLLVGSLTASSSQPAVRGTVRGGESVSLSFGGRL